jgi:O-antigen ligase
MLLWTIAADDPLLRGKDNRMSRFKPRAQNPLPAELGEGEASQTWPAAGAFSASFSPKADARARWLPGRPLPFPRLSTPEMLLPTPVEKLAFGCNMIFLFLVTSRLIELGPPSLHLMMILAGIAGLLAILSGNLWKTMTSSLGVLFLCLTAWFALTVLLSVWPGGSAQVFEDEWLKAACTFFLVASVTVTSRQAILAIRVTAWALLASGVLALGVGDFDDGRLYVPGGGTFGNPNYLAAAMCMGLLFWWFVVHNPKERKISRVIAIASMATLIVVTIETGSRAAMLALLATIPFAIMQYSLANRLRISAVLALMLLLGFMLAPSLAVERLKSVFGADDQPASELELRSQEAADASTESRKTVLRRSLEITAQHPLLGVGIGMFVVAENDLAATEGQPGTWRGTHNTYTQVSSETGIPGLFLFVAILAMDWRAMRALRKDARLTLHPDGPQIRAAATALWLVLVNTMVSGFFAHFAYSSTIPIISGLIFALSRGASRELELIGAQRPDVDGAPGSVKGVRQPESRSESALVPVNRATALQPAGGSPQGR